MVQGIQKPGAEGDDTASRAGPHPVVPGQGSAETEVAAMFNQEPRWPLNFIVMGSEVSLRSTFRTRSGEDNWDHKQLSDHSTSLCNATGLKPTWEASTQVKVTISSVSGWQ